MSRSPCCLLARFSGYLLCCLLGRFSSGRLSHSMFLCGLRLDRLRRLLKGGWFRHLQRLCRLSRFCWLSRFRRLGWFCRLGRFRWLCFNFGFSGWFLLLRLLGNPHKRQSQSRCQHCCPPFQHTTRTSLRVFAFRRHCFCDVRKIERRAPTLSSLNQQGTFVVHLRFPLWQFFSCGRRWVTDERPD